MTARVAAPVIPTGELARLWLEAWREVEAIEIAIIGKRTGPKPVFPVKTVRY